MNSHKPVGLNFLAAFAVLVFGIILSFFMPDSASAMTPETNSYHGPSHKPAFLTTPCPLEDSRNCYWNAGKAGNGGGHSFYSIPFGNMDCLFYWQKSYRSHNTCVPANY